jgi:phosphatidate cytidylyltransferase
MKQRIVAFIILWAVMLSIAALAGNPGIFVLIAIFSSGTLWELVRLLRATSQPVDAPVAYGAWALLLLGTVFAGPHLIPPVATIGAVFALLVAVMVLRQPLGSISASTAATAIAVLLVTMAFVPMLLLMHEFPDNGLLLFIWIIAVAKFTDVGALLIGTWIGRHRMCPRLSPHKTWEGFAGGLLAALIISSGFVALFGNWMPEGLTLTTAMLMALPIAVAGVIADLLESALKREAKVKDSGTVIPGIGGFFDLTDSAVLAMPTGYLLLWILL